MAVRPSDGESFKSVSLYVEDVCRWFLENGLLLSPTKREAILFRTKIQRDKITTASGIDVAWAVVPRHVATRFGCGGIFSEGFIANFWKVCQWKNFENPLKIDKVIDRACCTTFLATLYYWTKIVNQWVALIRQNMRCCMKRLGLGLDKVVFTSLKCVADRYTELSNDGVVTGSAGNGSCSLTSRCAILPTHVKYSMSV